MASSQDTEITLGTGKLLFLFFSLVAICAVFFALGYSLGRKSEPAITTASAAIGPQSPAATSKTSSQAAPPMTFYKAVEQKDATPELTPPADAKTDATTASTPATPAPASTASPVDPSTTIPSAGYYVQVAAVSKQEDADSLVDALKKKEYSAFVSPSATTDKLFHVQVGPFSDIKDAEAMRAKLISDGYSPIVKK
ncbi:MAG TPA: SPOR domain-containing protein [Candidatus Acidoferrales bacterium]|nr:SPOR domain-containing protein [Candidatus Acidoferrales bacterium]